MAMKAATTVASGVPRGLRSLFSTLSTNFPFPSQPTANQSQRPQAEPSTNLFVSARVVKDRASGWSKGFGFVRYSTLEGAAAGIQGMDGKFLDGWVIFAEYAKPRDSPSSPPSYGGNRQ